MSACAGARKKILAKGRLHRRVQLQNYSAPVRRRLVMLFFSVALFSLLSLVQSAASFSMHYVTRARTTQITGSLFEL